jgi:hypothetical protein
MIKFLTAIEWWRYARKAFRDALKIPLKNAGETFGPAEAL